MLAACGGPPAGYSEAEWQSMSEPARDEVRAELRAEAAERRAAERARREKAEAERQRSIRRLYQHEMAQLSADPAYRRQGSALISQVTVRGGSVNVPVGGGLSFSDAWRPHGVTAFTLAECETKAVRFKRTRKSGAVTVHAKRVNGQVHLAGHGFDLGCDRAGASGPHAGPFPPTTDTTVSVENKLLKVRLEVHPYGSRAPSEKAAEQERKLELLRELLGRD